jgi:limonene-1,2-epoxide hydrolase
VKVAAILLAAALLAGCGGSHRHRSATAIVRSWSAALDRNDNEAAARLFADGAHVVQDTELVLANHHDAVRWNASLPCGGSIVSLAQQGESQILAVFRLEERPGHRCDGPGTMAAAIFRVSGGKIVLWHQTGVPPSDEGGTSV